MSHTLVAETERLVLRQFALADAEALSNVFGDAEVMCFGPGVQTSDWINNWLHERIEEYRTQPFGRWAVVETKSDAVIGYCGLTSFPDINGRPEIELGYRLIRACWGYGYATEAARSVRDHAFDALEISRLISIIDPANSASIRVAEKLSMRREGHVLLPGYTHPDRIYAVSRPE